MYVCGNVWMGERRAAEMREATSSEAFSGTKVVFSKLI
jgi:hypothetical protein